MSAGAITAALGACIALGVASNRLRLNWAYRLACWYNDYEYLGREGVILQRGDLDCGVACLEMLLRCKGVTVSPDALAGMRLLRGTSMLVLRDALMDLGVPSSGMRLRSVEALTALLSDGRRAIVSLDRNYLSPRLRRGNQRMPQLRHWVVVEAGDAKAVTLCDPAFGRVRLGLDAFATHWAGTALVPAHRERVEPLRDACASEEAC